MLISNTGRRYLTGVAGLLELHYTSTLQDSDVLNATQAGLPGFIVVAGNRRDLLNLTSGLHFQLGPASNLRIGAVTPLRSAPIEPLIPRFKSFSTGSSNSANGHMQLGWQSN